MTIDSGDGYVPLLRGANDMGSIGQDNRRSRSSQQQQFISGSSANMSQHEVRQALAKGLSNNQFKRYQTLDHQHMDASETIA